MCSRHYYLYILVLETTLKCVDTQGKSSFKICQIAAYVDDTVVIGRSERASEKNSQGRQEATNMGLNDERGKNEKTKA